MPEGQAIEGVDPASLGAAATSPVTAAPNEGGAGGSTESASPASPPAVAPDVLTEAGITREQFDNAVQLFKAVNDPQRAGATIKFLQDNWEQHNAQLAKTHEPTVAELVRAELGDEFGQFAEKLAPAIEKVIERKMQPVQHRFAAEAQEKATAENLNHTVAFAQEFLGEDSLPVALSDEMTKIVGIMPPAQGVSPKDYIYTIGKVAMSNLNMSKITKPASSPSKPAKPASPISQLAKSAARPNEGVSAAPKDLSLDEAVKLADKQLSGQS